MMFFRPACNLWQVKCLSHLALLMTAVAAFGQAPAKGPEFEVATIRTSPPLDPLKIRAGQMPHVGMAIDGARVDIGMMSLVELVCAAYRVKSYQIAAPDWASSQRFDILAKLPQGANKDQVPEMLQSLLADRFKLTFHKENKERAVYALVPGKNGVKLKEAAPDPNAPADGAATGNATGIRMTQANGGRGMVLEGGQSGRTKVSAGANGTIHLEFERMSMAGMTEILSRFVDRPVVDMTGLKGNYEVALDLALEDMVRMARASGVAVPGMPPGAGAAEPGRAPADAASEPSGSTIFAAIQQLGLRLDGRKTPVDIFVVDNAEKTPVEN